MAGEDFCRAKWRHSDWTKWTCPERRVTPWGMRGGAIPYYWQLCTFWGQGSSSTFSPRANIAICIGAEKPTWNATQVGGPHPQHPAELHVLELQSCSQECVLLFQPQAGAETVTLWLGGSHSRGDGQSDHGIFKPWGWSLGMVTSSVLPCPALLCMQPAANHIPWPSRSRAA